MGKGVSVCVSVFVCTHLFPCVLKTNNNELLFSVHKMSPNVSVDSPFLCIPAVLETLPAAAKYHFLVHCSCWLKCFVYKSHWRIEWLNYSFTTLSSFTYTGLWMGAGLLTSWPYPVKGVSIHKQVRTRMYTCLSSDASTLLFFGLG